MQEVEADALGVEDLLDFAHVDPHLVAAPAVVGEAAAGQQPLGRLEDHGQVVALLGQGGHLLADPLQEVARPTDSSWASAGGTTAWNT